MVNISGSKCFPVAAAVAAVLWVSACAANQSSDAAPAARPGSFRAIMAVKLPGVYGPHLAAADQAAAADSVVTAQPASAKAVLAAKLPGVYGPHLAAADAGSTQVVSSTCQPGSFAAVMSAKLPPSARPGNPEIYKDCR